MQPGSWSPQNGEQAEASVPLKDPVALAMKAAMETPLASTAITAEAPSDANENGNEPTGATAATSLPPKRPSFTTRHRLRQAMSNLTGKGNGSERKPIKDLKHKKSMRKRSSAEEESWTAVDHDELDQANSYVSDSMYLVLDNPISVLYANETVEFRAHAFCENAKSSSCNQPANQQTSHGTLFLTTFRLLFISFERLRQHQQKQEQFNEEDELDDEEDDVEGQTQGQEDGKATQAIPVDDGTTSKEVLDQSRRSMMNGSCDELAKMCRPSPQTLVEISLANIADVSEFRASRKGGGGVSAFVEVACKNFEMIKFGFPCESTSGDLYVRIQKALMTSQGYCADVLISDASSLPDPGWGVYDAQREFDRLGFKTLFHSNSQHYSGFRVSQANSHYKLCSTYPSAVIVPACVSDGELRKISHFRARGRIPAITYRHRNQAIIARCAQPLVGLRRKRCPADEAYIRALQRETKGKLLFIDCRSQTSAYGNVALGGGFEVLDYYQNSGIVFMGIENIHSMRDSIRKLFELIKNEVRGNEKANWLSSVESTRWLEHVRSILVSCSMCVSKLVDEETSLLIHCSDGWDRTAQIVALTKLCVDPYYRSLAGFQVLIEQEWCAFGHQFRSRCGRSNDNPTNYWEDDNTSPVFMQFLDAVWQLTRQFPCSFEFNERFLIELVDEVYRKKSGSFLHDCEQERIAALTPLRCVSVWKLLESSDDASEFLNPFYVRGTSREVEGIITCGTSDGPTGGTGQNGVSGAAVGITMGNRNERSPEILRFKWHTSCLAIWSAFYLRSLDSNESRVSQDAWAKELQLTQRDLQTKLSVVNQELQSQLEMNSEMASELEKLRKEREALRAALAGQVFTDNTTGVFVSEQDDDDGDGVLLSVTPVDPNEPTLANGATRGNRQMIPPSSGGFIGATMNSEYELIMTYFDPYKPTNPATSNSVTASVT